MLIVLVLSFPQGSSEDPPELSGKASEMYGYSGAARLHVFARRSEMTRVGSLALKFRSRINTKPSELSNRYNGSTEYTLYLAIVHD
jgi:hypothetical protein